MFHKLCLAQTVEHTNHLLVAPNCLQNKLIDKIDAEIAKVQDGNAGYIGVKMNSLTDKKLIDKLIEASMAGVQIDLIVRGISLPHSGSGRVYRQYSGHQYCGKIFRTFQNLYFRKR